MTAKSTTYATDRTREALVALAEREKVELDVLLRLAASTQSRCYLRLRASVTPRLLRHGDVPLAILCAVCHNAATRGGTDPARMARQARFDARYLASRSRLYRLMNLYLEAGVWSDVIPSESGPIVEPGQ